MFQFFFYWDRFHPFSSGGVTNGALPKWRCHGTAAEGVEFPTEFSSMLSDWVMVSNMVILLYNIIGATVNPAFVPWFCRSKQGYNIMAWVACKNKHGAKGDIMNNQSECEMNMVFLFKTWRACKPRVSPFVVVERCENESIAAQPKPRLTRHSIIDSSSTSKKGVLNTYTLLYNHIYIQCFEIICTYWFLHFFMGAWRI